MWQGGGQGTAVSPKPCPRGYQGCHFPLTLDKSISLACFPPTCFTPLCGAVLLCHKAKGTPGITSALFQQASQHPCPGAPRSIPNVTRIACVTWGQSCAPAPGTIPCLQQAAILERQITWGGFPTWCDSRSFVSALQVSQSPCPRRFPHLRYAPSPRDGVGLKGVFLCF